MLERSSHRILFGLMLAAAVNLGLFYLMQQMTAEKNIARPDLEQAQLLDFVRLKKDERQAETKKRQLPKKPPPPKAPPPPPEAPAPQTPKPNAPTPKLSVPKLALPMNIAGGPYLGDFQSAPQVAAVNTNPVIDNEVMPLVRIPPRYPRAAARRGIEGVVTVSFTITKDGRVKDAKVIKATPENVFDQAAIKAIEQWKFKAKIVDGVAVERQATQEIEFNLSR
jgi:protein TonB